MNYLVFGILGYSLLAIVAILDKFIVSNEKVKPVVFTFYSTIFLLALFVFIPFGIQHLGPIHNWILAFLAGVSYTLALYAMYRSFTLSEVSHAGPFIGAAVPFFSIILNYFFLRDAIAPLQYAGVTLLIIGSLVISFEKNKRHSGWHIGTLWALLSAFCFAFFYLASKYIFTQVNFTSGLVWTWGAAGISGLLLLFFPQVRRALTRKALIKKHPTHELAVIFFDKFLALTAVIFIQLAVARGNVTIVNALNGLQYGLLIILVALLSKFLPRRFTESYTRGEIIQEFSAVVVISLGLALLIF